MSKIDEFKNIFNKEMGDISKDIPFIGSVFMNKSAFDAMLSDKEIAKNILQNRIPGLSRDDIETMVEGIDEDGVENALPSFDKIEGERMNGDFLNNITDDVFEKVYPNIPNDMVDELSDDRLKLYKQLMGNSDTPKSSTSIPNPFANVAYSMASISLKVNTKQKNKMASDAIKGGLNDVKDKSKSIVDDDSMLIKEIRKMKENFVLNIREFMRGVEEIIPAAVEAGIVVGSSISGAVMMVATPVFPVPSFNIPGMITLLLTAKSTISELISKITGVMTFFLKLFDVVELFPTQIVTIIVTILLALYDLLKSLKKTLSLSLGGLSGGIKKAMDKQREKFDPDETYKEKDDDGKTHKKRKFSNEDVRDINKAFDGFDGMGVEIDGIVSQIDNIVNGLSELQSGGELTYDIYYPDGSVETGVTLDYVEALRDEYDIEYK